MSRSGPLFKNKLIDRKPYPKNLRTHPQYVVTDPKEFAAEKRRLLDALERFRGQRASAPAHPLFGEMTDDERGWGMYKHLDHHLRQFGV